MESNIKEIKKLKTEIVPQSEWVKLSRDILLQTINSDQQYQKAGVGIGGYFYLFTNGFRQHLLEPAVIMLLVLGVFLGSSLTINAAFYSLPGDNLYPVKIALERTHAALVTGDEKKVELKIEFAEKRIAEFDKIVAQLDTDPAAKKKRIQAVVEEFRNNVVAVNDHLNKIKQADSNITEADKEQTLRMAISVGSKTEELAKSIDEKIEELPAVEQLEVKAIIAQAVLSAQETSLSAQQIVEEASQLTAEETANTSGTVEGADSETEISETATEPALEGSPNVTEEETEEAEVNPEVSL